MNITLTADQAKLIAELSERIKTQDNQCTRHPVFLVQKSVTRTRWETVTSCFTEVGARKYLELNRHNLDGPEPPRIYVNSLYGNQEMIGIAALIVQLGQAVKGPETNQRGGEPTCPSCGALVPDWVH